MVYFVKYRTYQFETEQGIQVTAKSKAEAYDRAVYEEIPKRAGIVPYSAWVESVTYQNGNYRRFNTSEANPY